jgi:hypothetical protein
MQQSKNTHLQLYNYIYKLQYLLCVNLKKNLYNKLLKELTED